MTQTYKVQVSMNQAHIVESGFVWKQGDFGFNIEIEVLDFDTTGATPQIIFRKSTGAVEATEISVAGNKFTYAIRGTELDTPGPCVCDLKLNDSTTKRVSTASFKYFVIPDTMDGLEQEASSYSDTIEQLLENTLQKSETAGLVKNDGSINSTIENNVANNTVRISDLESELNYHKSEADAKFIMSIYSYSKVNPTGSEGLLLKNNTVLTGTGYKASATVNEGDVYKITGRQFNDTNAPAYILRNNGDIVYIGWIATGYFSDYVIAIPAGVDELVVNLNSSLGVNSAIKKADKITTEQVWNIIEKGITSEKAGNSFSFDWESGGWINIFNGNIVESESYSHTDYLPVIEGQKIRINGDFGGYSGPAFYDENKKYIEYAYEGTYGLKEYIIPVPNGAKYVRLTTSNSTASDAITKTLYYENFYSTIQMTLENTIANSSYIGNEYFEKIDGEIQYGVMNREGGVVENGDSRIICMVKSGDNLLVTGQQISSYFPIAILLNNNTVVSYIDYGSASLVNRYKVLIPNGVNKIVVNGSGENAVVLRASGTNIIQSHGGWKTQPITPESGIIATDGSTVAAGNHMTVEVQPGEHYRISGRKWSNYVPGYLISNGTSIISSGQPSDEYFTDIEIVIPENGKILYINGNSAIGLKCIRYSKIDYQLKTKQLSGKTMVWFGTSIPQNSTYFEGANWSIPSYAGHILGMNVINECVGASIAARGIYNKITQDDPYGWTEVSWHAVFRSLGANLTEKQDLIDNYDSKWYALLGGPTDPLYPGAKPQSLTDDMKAYILSCSYENKLIPYLDGTKSMPDLFVFEHGYNDSQATVFSGISPDEQNLNRSLYSDAMYFYFKKIFEANPQAKILVVSHYDNSSATGVKTFAAQKELAIYHGVHFCDVANNVGWTQRLVETTGYWDDGIWIPSGGTSRTITRLAQCIPDQIHPHTDKSGNAVKREAKIIADYISANINLD